MEHSSIYLLLLLLLTRGATSLTPITGSNLGSGGGKGYLYPEEIPSNEQGVIGFASTEYTVHENSMSAVVTVTRICNAAQATLCAGEISVAYSTETIPRVPLPGTFSVTVGSNVITPTADLRNLLFIGDQIRVPWEEHRLDPILTTAHSVTTTNYQSYNITTEQRFGASGLRAYTRSSRVALPGINDHEIRVGENYVRTFRDLRE